MGESSRRDVASAVYFGETSFMSNLTIWLTPIWLLAVGATLGTLVLLAAWGLCWLFNRRLAHTIQETVSEGILLPISYTLIVLAALVAIAGPTMPFDRMVSSLQRLPYVSPQTFEVTVKARQPDAPVELAFRVDELQSYTLESEEEIAVSVEADKGFADPMLIVDDKRYAWTPGNNVARGFEADVSMLYITNESDLPTVVKGTFDLDVEMPEVLSIFTSSPNVLYGT